MKKQIERWIAVSLCICIWVSGMVPLHAANALDVSFSPKSPSVAVSDADQTVTIKVQMSGTQTIDAFIYHIVCDRSIEIASVSIGSITIDKELVMSGQEGTEYKISYMKPITTDHLGEITFKIPAGTPEGEYRITLETRENCGALIGETTKTLSAQTVIQVRESGSSSGDYTAALSGVTTATVGDAIEVSVTVSGSAFSSAQYALQYDTSRLKLKDAGGCEYSDHNGTVTVVDYGAEKTVPHVYKATFQALSDGAAIITLTDAAFGTADHAETGDMIEAKLSGKSITVNIAKREFAVTLPNIFSGYDTVTEGEDYTFAAKDPNNYNYGTVTATMGNGSSFTVTPQDGVYTIENVTGALVIRGERTAKQYTVIFKTATDVMLPQDGVVTYGTDYSFTMPVEENYSVSITSIKCNGANVEYSAKDGRVTIAGTNILGNLVITLDKVRTNAAVTVNGSAASELTADDEVAEPGKDFSVTLKPDSRYSYVVTATVNGVKVELTQNGNVFTIAGKDVAAGSIVFTVTKTLKTDGFETSKYLQFNGTMVWLVKNEVPQTSGSLYTYDGQVMLWSEKYNAYCCLVIAKTSEELTGDKLGLQSGTVTAVDYGMDVNNSGRVDMNDVQLTYNLYNNKYQSFTDTVTMEKMLRADVNGSGNVDTEDACAIVNHILGK